MSSLFLIGLLGCGTDPVEPEAPSFPEPIVGGTPETDSLADAPARCGMSAYTWQRGSDLGSVVATKPETTFKASILQALADTQEMDLPPLTHDVSTHLVTYRTQDRGKAVDATTLVAWPTGVAEDAEPFPTLLLLHGTSGFTDGCGPTLDQEASALAAALASAGFIVVAPDYIGLKATEPPTGFPHPYLVGEATAMASLDAVRALRHLGDMDLGTGLAKPSSQVAVVGGSQGGHAALWIDRLAPYYARELTIAGIAATVPPSDMVTQGNLALQTLRDSSSNLLAFYGVSASWYGYEDRLDEVFVPPYDTDVPAALAAGCDPTDTVTVPTTLEEVYQQTLLDAARGAGLETIEPWGCMVAESGLTSTSTPRIEQEAESYGILFVTGEADDLVDTPTERAAFAELCTGGMPMTYLECAGASHTRATVWALPEILAFLQARLAGEAFTKNCEVPAPSRCSGTPADDG